MTKLEIFHLDFILQSSEKQYVHLYNYTNYVQAIYRKKQVTGVYMIHRKHLT